MKQVKESSIEMQNTEVAAEDILKIRLENKSQRLETELAEKKQLLVKNKVFGPHMKLLCLKEKSVSRNSELVKIKKS